MSEKEEKSHGTTENEDDDGCAWETIYSKFTPAQKRRAVELLRDDERESTRPKEIVWDVWTLVIPYTLCKLRSRAALSATSTQFRRAIGHLAMAVYTGKTDRLRAHIYRCMSYFLYTQHKVVIVQATRRTGTRDWHISDILHDRHAGNVAGLQLGEMGGHSIHCLSGVIVSMSGKPVSTTEISFRPEILFAAPRPSLFIYIAIKRAKKDLHAMAVAKETTAVWKERLKKIPLMMRFDDCTRTTIRPFHFLYAPVNAMVTAFEASYEPTNAGANADKDNHRDKQIAFKVVVDYLRTFFKKYITPLPAVPTDVSKK